MKLQNHGSSIPCNHRYIYRISEEFSALNFNKAHACNNIQMLTTPANCGLFLTPDQLMDDVSKSHSDPGESELQILAKRMSGGISTTCWSNCKRGPIIYM